MIKFPSIALGLRLYLFKRKTVILNMKLNNYFAPLAEEEAKETATSLRIDTSSGQIFDKICSALTLDPEVYVMAPENTSVRELLFQMLKASKYVVRFFQKICPYRGNTDPIPKDYLNNHAICICSWTMLTCEKGLWICVSKSDIP